MRCSAYEGCQLQRACPSIFLFLKASRLFSFPVFPRFVRLVRRAPLPSSVPGRVPVTSSYSSRTSSRDAHAHDVWPDWGKGLGRNAPHLTEDASRHQLQRRAAFHPAAKIERHWENLNAKFKVRWSYSAGVPAAAFKVQPSSAAVARPVRQRQRSMASCRARATASFFLSAAPCFIFSRYFTRACQWGW